MRDYSAYQQRFQRVVDHIYQNLDAPLDLNHLADIAHMSPCHWHRVYAAMCGETLAATVKRLRLHRAAAQLINSEQSVEKISAASGYSTLQSFNRAFGKAYGMPPARFRREGGHSRFTLAMRSEEQLQMTDSTAMDVRIETRDTALPLLCIAHSGPYMNIGNAFDKLNGWMVENQVWPQLKGVMALYHDNPQTVAPEQLRSHACVSLSSEEGFNIPDDFVRVSIAAGRYAILRYKGPYAGLQQAYEWFYGVWLPQSGEEIGNQPCVEEYLNNPREVAPEALLTEIYMPLV